MTETFAMVVRTPHAVVFERDLVSARVPTETGQLGLRPRTEPMIVAIEPGLLLLAHATGKDYAASAGGLLRVGASQSILYTAFALVGDSAQTVLAELERALSDPSSELSARQQLEDLELRILEELRRGETSRSGLGRSHG